MSVYTADPQKWDHNLWIGDTYQPVEVSLIDSAGVAIDLTGVEGDAQIRTEVGGRVLLEPTVTITDDAGGTFTWSSPATETAALAAGPAIYSVRLTWVDGTVRTILEGRIQIKRVVR